MSPGLVCSRNDLYAGQTFVAVNLPVTRTSAPAGSETAAQRKTVAPIARISRPVICSHPSSVDLDFGIRAVSDRQLLQGDLIDNAALAVGVDRACSLDHGGEAGVGTGEADADLRDQLTRSVLGAGNADAI